MICVSIVSHGHGEMVVRLIKQLEDCPEVGQIILTRNIYEPLIQQQTDKLEIIENQSPAGFGSNHNAAFRRCGEPYFCVVNPDIRLSENLFPILVSCLTAHKAAVIAPLVVSEAGEVEDSVRRFPTVYSLISKAFGGPDGRYFIQTSQASFCPEWVAGMFMLFDRAAYDRIGGFDSRFYLYYEDVDLCARLWNAGLKVVVCPSVVVIHVARRESHRKVRFLRWHLVSMLRYFCKYGYRRPRLTGPGRV